MNDLPSVAQLAALRERCERLPRLSWHPSGIVPGDYFISWSSLSCLLSMLADQQRESAR